MCVYVCVGVLAATHGLAAHLSWQLVTILQGAASHGVCETQSEDQAVDGCLPAAAAADALVEELHPVLELCCCL